MTDEKYQHHENCDFWVDQYPWECTCGAEIKRLQARITKLEKGLRLCAANAGFSDTAVACRMVIETVKKVLDRESP